MTEYFLYYLNESGFKCVNAMNETDFSYVKAVATDQLMEYFPPSRWGEIGCTSTSVQSVPFGIYTSFGVLAWMRFNDVVSDGHQFDIDVFYHESGQFQIVISEFGCELDESHNYAYVTNSPMMCILQSLETGIVTEWRNLMVEMEIEEMTE